MDESLALLRQISLSLQALSLEVHRQGQVLSRVQELVDELHPGADYEVVSQSPWQILQLLTRAASGLVLQGLVPLLLCRLCQPSLSGPRLPLVPRLQPVTQVQKVPRSAITEEERREITRSTGASFRRCLDGAVRGTSGRDRNPLQSRCCVVVASFSGQRFNPPLLHDQFAHVKELCKKGSATGSSIFCGFPAQWEAKIACEAAGLSLPVRQSNVSQQ